MTKSVIRVEHPYDGKGLFNSNNEDGVRLINIHSHHDNIINRHTLENGFPSYHSDKYLQDIISYSDLKNYNFAFKDLAQLETALTKDELKEFIEVLGFRVLMLDVIGCIESPFQIIFKKELIQESKDISFMFL